MRTLEVCFFNRSYYPDLGSTGQLLTELAENLVQRYGCRVTVVAGPPLRTVLSGRKGAIRWSLVRTERRHGVEILRAGGTTFRPNRFPSRAANYLSYFLSACLAALRIRQADVIVALTDPPIIGLAALLAARLSRARFVFVCQDVFPEVAQLLEDFRSKWVSDVLQYVNRLLLRKSDRVVALGDTMRKRLIEEKGAEPSKVLVIHNWADCQAIVPASKDNGFSREHALLDKFVVMHSGNVGLSQDLDTLLDAARLLMTHSDLVVAVVGDGAKSQALRLRAQGEGIDNVRFIPYQPKARLTESFATADVFVVSLKAGLAGYIVPSKLYGILAAGRPCIAAVEDSCEVAVIIKQYDCGLLARTGDAEDLARQIRVLHQDRALGKRLGENARKAAADFDLPRAAGAYYELMKDLAPARSKPMRRPSPMKRILDVTLAGLGLILSAPLWALIAICVKLEDGGPVFYGQERVGKDGKLFRSWKFRSMIPDSDQKFGPLQADQRDPRVTRFGRLLRVTAMDELPQLWNIFVGDMSFVGPRALMPREIEVTQRSRPVPIESIPGYQDRHRVRPGLTGLAQIYADRDIPRRQKFKLDLLYIRKQSFWLDCKLILLSFWITFRGAWEVRGKKY